MSTSKPLDGRRAVVTGAGSGIGEAIALAYAQAGAQLVLADLDAARADSVARRCRALGTQAETVIGDVGDEAAAHRIIDHCVQALGGIDILVNNAGMLTQARCADMSTAMWDEMLRVDLRSVFLCARRRTCSRSAGVASSTSPRSWASRAAWS
jgi:3-oxoacyl-[acyl-carrier protein] reductase